MPLVIPPKELLNMGRVEYDPHTGNPIFAKEATKEQIALYHQWCADIKKAQEKALEIEE